ncbi:MAG: hypothetical protein DDT40_01739 [candidate division WS2 bacterium]|nr:hypothetical protein [Candidatus Psychracetigena formicireducens]
MNKQKVAQFNKIKQNNKIIMRYLSELKPEQIRKLYYLREYQKTQSKKSTMSGLVREAVDLYLVNYKKEIDAGMSLLKVNLD